MMEEKKPRRPAQIVLYRCACRHCGSAEEELRRVAAPHAASLSVQHIDDGERLRGFAGWKTPIVCVDGVGVSQSGIDVKAWEAAIGGGVELATPVPPRAGAAGAFPLGAVVPRRRARLSWMAAVFALAVFLHWAVPVGPHAWHWVHLFAQKLFFIPILMAAAWFDAREIFWTVAAVTAVFLVHIVRDWAQFPMVQAEQLSELTHIWIAGPAAWLFFRNTRRSVSDLRRAHEDTLLAMISSLELRERYTAGHSRRVAGYSRLIAAALGIRDESLLGGVVNGALLHDIGKIGVPDAVLLKAGALDDEEWRLMRAHPERGAALVAGVPSLVGAVPVIVYHHERYDGRGYPAGLSGSVIPLGARIVAVADVYDALTTARPYKRALPHEEALSSLRADAGGKFDPAGVEAFARVSAQALRDTAERD